MGKLTSAGFVPKDDPMFSTGPELFSRPEYKKSSTNTAKNTTGATLAKSSSVGGEADKMRPAVDAAEATLMELAGGKTKPAPTQKDDPDQ